MGARCPGKQHQADAPTGSVTRGEVAGPLGSAFAEQAPRRCGLWGHCRAGPGSGGPGQPAHLLRPTRGMGASVRASGHPTPLPPQALVLRGPPRPGAGLAGGRAAGSRGVGAAPAGPLQTSTEATARGRRPQRLEPAWSTPPAPPAPPAHDRSALPSEGWAVSHAPPSPCPAHPAGLAGPAHSAGQARPGLGTGPAPCLRQRATALGGRVLRSREEAASWLSLGLGVTRA